MCFLLRGRDQPCSIGSYKVDAGRWSIEKQYTTEQCPLLPYLCRFIVSFPSLTRAWRLPSSLCSEGAGDGLCRVDAHRLLLSLFFSLSLSPFVSLLVSLLLSCSAFLALSLLSVSLSLALSLTLSLSLSFPFSSLLSLFRSLSFSLTLFRSLDLILPLSFSSFFLFPFLSFSLSRPLSLSPPTLAPTRALIRPPLP